MTKKLITAAFALFLCVGAFAQGTNFRDISFAEALKQSAAEGKPVFLDCYTEWCGPCKAMAAEVFPLRAAGDYFNKNFVNIKIDMEKGEGVELARKYKIRAYPTFLILDSEGTEIYRVLGGGTLDYFIARIEAGTKSNKSREELALEYESGKINKEDLTTYWLMDGKENSTLEERVKLNDTLYGMLSESDKLSSAYWQLLALGMLISPQSEMMDFVLANRAEIEKTNGKEEVNQIIYSSFNQAFSPMISRPISPEQAAKLPAIVAKLKANDVDNKEQLLAVAGLAGARAQGDVDAYIGILESMNYAGIHPYTISTYFNSTKSMLADMDDTEGYYTRMYDILSKIIADPAIDGDKETLLEPLAADYKQIIGTK